VSNQPVLITGCQRSGTTLLNLILDSHPGIRGVDEMRFDPQNVQHYLSDPAFAPRVSFKLPQYAGSAGLVRRLPGVKLLWCVRDPRDVVASMLALVLRLPDGQVVPWPAHAGGGVHEVIVARQLLGDAVPPDLDPWLAHYDEVSGTEPLAWSRTLLVTTAALCWRLKNELRDVYIRARVTCRDVAYERLTGNPMSEVRQIAAFLGLPWSERLLQHHQFHQGKSVGNTDNTRAIDVRSIGRWKAQLTSEDIALLGVICGPRADAFGYRL
jgi:hypothetical protein